MGLMIGWARQMILFILLAMIIELLLPNSSMKKYINMVVGLLLITIFLQPLFHLFQVDVETLLNKALPSLSITEEQENMKNSIELKKNEIQDAQAAYVVEEMAVQMKEQAEEELGEAYGVSISDITLEFQGDEIDAEAIEVVNVIVTNQKVGQNHQGPIKEVVIDLDKQPKSEEAAKTSEMKAYLSEVWQLDDERIVILWEGGV